MMVWGQWQWNYIYFWTSVAMDVGEKDQFVSVCQGCHSLEHMGLLLYNWGTSKQYTLVQNAGFLGHF